MKLFTQNADLKKTGIFSWTLPAHFIELTNGKKFFTCPNAGACGAFCYAKNGTYQFSNVKKAHREKLELVLNDRLKWIELINNELQNKKYQNKFIRIHDAGDFFNETYLYDWLLIAKNNPQCNFYAYTKEVKMLKTAKQKNLIPSNFTVIFSYGGKQDHLIDKTKDRHSDVFTNYAEMIEKNYIDISDDDKLSATSKNFKIGLFRNNIPHVIKKLKNKKFSEWSKIVNNEKM